MDPNIYNYVIANGGPPRNSGNFNRWMNGLAQYLAGDGAAWKYGSGAGAPTLPTDLDNLFSGDTQVGGSFVFWYNSVATTYQIYMLVSAGTWIGIISSSYDAFGAPYTESVPAYWLINGSPNNIGAALDDLADRQNTLLVTSHYNVNLASAITIPVNTSDNPAQVEVAHSFTRPWATFIVTHSGFFSAASSWAVSVVMVIDGYIYLDRTLGSSFGLKQPAAVSNSVPLFAADVNVKELMGTGSVQVGLSFGNVDPVNTYTINAFTGIHYTIIEHE
jgi:hypothetical protein